MKRSFLALAALSILILACGSFTRGSTPTATASAIYLLTPAASETPAPGDVLAPIPVHVGYGVGNRWFEIYFTDPTNPASQQESGGLDGPLVAAIDAARTSVDAAMYSLTLHSVRDALIRAHRRGVNVRVVMESDNLDAAEPQALQEAGIPILGDRVQGSMHDKFLIIDRGEVWTGSMNFTYSGTYADNNSLVRIRSQEVADDYEAEFNEMFVDDKFGPGRGSQTPNPHVTVDGTALDVYFSPDDHVQGALVQLLSEAQSSIYFLAYSFTADPLGEMIRKRAAAGVKVAGVMDAEQMLANIGSEFDAFRADGLAVRLDGNPDQMHHKMIIIDGQIVVIGSYNFTRNADTTNDENLIVIHDPQIAAQCTLEFARVYGAATPQP